MAAEKQQTEVLRRDESVETKKNELFKSGIDLCGFDLASVRPSRWATSGATSGFFLFPVLSLFPNLFLDNPEALILWGAGLFGFVSLASSIYISKKVKGLSLFLDDFQAAAESSYAAIKLEIDELCVDEKVSRNEILPPNYDKIKKTAGSTADKVWKGADLAGLDSLAGFEIGGIWGKLAGAAIGAVVGNIFEERARVRYESVPQHLKKLALLEDNLKDLSEKRIPSQRTTISHLKKFGRFSAALSITICSAVIYARLF